MGSSLALAHNLLAYLDRSHGVSTGPGRTLSLQRADVTLGLGRPADQGTQVQQAIIECRIGAILSRQSVQIKTKLPSTGALPAHQSTDDTARIGIDQGRSPSEPKAQNGLRHVVPNPRKHPQLEIGVGDMSVEFLDQSFRNFNDVLSPPAQSERLHRLQS